MKIKNMKLGATGAFPEGHAGDDDEGELKLAMAADHRNGIVRVEFGAPVAWLGLPAALARQFAAALVEKADELDKRKS